MFLAFIVLVQDNRLSAEHILSYLNQLSLINNSIKINGVADFIPVLHGLFHFLLRHLNGPIKDLVLGLVESSWIDYSAVIASHDRHLRLVLTLIPAFFASLIDCIFKGFYNMLLKQIFELLVVESARAVVSLEDTVKEFAQRPGYRCCDYHEEEDKRAC